MCVETIIFNTFEHPKNVRSLKKNYVPIIKKNLKDYNSYPLRKSKKMQKDIFESQKKKMYHFIIIKKYQRQKFTHAVCH